MALGCCAFVFSFRKEDQTRILVGCFGLLDFFVESFNGLESVSECVVDVSDL